MKVVKWTIHRPATPLVAAAWVIAQSFISGSSPASAVEGMPPIQQEVVSPLKRAEPPKGTGATGEPRLKEAPHPGVPVDDRTYRELKERAKGGP
jgi:hypothetical protein